MSYRVPSLRSVQIYTFSVFPNTSRSGTTIDDLNIDFKDGDKPFSELAAYGGQLNGFTFLKVSVLCAKRTKRNTAFTITIQTCVQSGIFIIYNLYKPYLSFLTYNNAKYVDQMMNIFVLVRIRDMHG